MIPMTWRRFRETSQGTLMKIDTFQREEEVGKAVGDVVKAPG